MKKPTSMRHKGFLIAIEGIDGAGKTTQAKLLGHKLVQEEYDVLVLKEPTTGEWGRKISFMSKHGRNLSAHDEFMYFFEDRKEDVTKNICPALADGKVVIMDRYYYSNMAYQGAKGLDQDLIEKKNLEIAPKPDLVILLDIDVETAHHRIINFRKGQPNHFEQRLTPVRERFLKIAATHQEIVKLDGNQNVDELSSQILELVLSRVGANVERKIVKLNG